MSGNGNGAHSPGAADLRGAPAVNGNGNGGQSRGATWSIQPMVSYPQQMTVGRPHLVEVDITLVAEPGTTAGWPLKHEEQRAYTCSLDGGGQFDTWAVNDENVVVHRFGGSYGAAQFIVVPREKIGSLNFWLTIENQGGVSIGAHQLSVDVSAVEGGGGGPTKETPVGISAVDLIEVAGNRAAEDPGGAGYGDLIDTDPESAFTVSASDPAEVTPVDPSPARGNLDNDRKNGDRQAVDEETPGVLKELFDRLPSPANIAPYEQPSEPADQDGEPDNFRLKECYNMVGLRRSRSGRLTLDLVPLFLPGTATGARTSFTARCLAADEHGTVFGVVAEPSVGGRGPRVRTVQSARVPPGTYQVTAELLYPARDRVRFHGLPVSPSHEPRRWEEIVAGVPRRLAAGTGPVHLVAAIEISGPDRLVAERIESVRRLFEYVAGTAEGMVDYSVISYGPHSIDHNRVYPEVSPVRLAWTETADVAIGALARLARTPGAPQNSYDDAAQIECVLSDLGEDWLTGNEGRPVLVTAGARPAHPPKAIYYSKIIPCARRNDWRAAITRLLSQHAGMTFGAIRDAETAEPDELWRQLGVHADTTTEYFDLPDFAARLGLATDTVQPIALPLISSTG